MTRLQQLAIAALLLRPSRIERNLDHVRQASHVGDAPNLWQLSLWVVRMWHRIVFRNETVGTSATTPVRHGWRARLLQYRPLRLPFLLAHGSVLPYDLTGLLSRPERVVTHLLGTHHDGNQFVYDFELLACYPGKLHELLANTREVVAHDNMKHRWLRDLAVYEGYHESLLAELERYMVHGSAALSDAQARDPDISFVAAMDWCRKQPSTPRETLRLLRTGHYHLEHGRC